MSSPVYKRVLLKLSGEALMGSQGYGVDASVAGRVAEEIKEVHGLGVELAIVIGGEISSEDCRPPRRGWTAFREI